MSPSGANSFQKHSDVITARRSSGGEYQRVDYFGLKDGESARVRFLEQGQDLTWAISHRVKVPNLSFPTDVLCLDQEDEGTSCPACLHEDEMVWTKRGLIPVKESMVGDVVYGIDGRLDEVIDVRKKKEKIVEFKFGSYRDGVKLTSDHLCFSISKKDAQNAIKGVYDNPSSPWLSFNNKYINQYVSLPLRADLGVSDITVSQASDLDIGDYWLYPVISDADRITPCSNVLRSVEAAWLCGLWVGDGWVSKRGIGIAFNSEHEDLIAKAFNQLENMGYRPKINDRTHEGRKSVNIEVHSTLLGIEMELLFGKGAFNKCLPFDSLSWDRKYQEAFIEGYYDADGRKEFGKQLFTRSKKLANGIYGMSIQCGKPITVRRYDHKGDVWVLCWPSYERTGKGFFCLVDDQEFYWNPITDINYFDEEVNVIDIETNRTNSFLTVSGITHNCQSENKEIMSRSTKGYLNVIWRGTEDEGNTRAPIYKRNDKGSPEKNPRGEKVVTGFEDGVFLWKCSKTVFEQIIDKDKKYKGLMSRDFLVTRQGAGLENTKYFIEPAVIDGGPESMTIADQNIAKNKFDIVSLTTPGSYGEMVNLLSGQQAAQNEPQSNIQEDVFSGGNAMRSSAFQR
jgi:hypothetical protein